MDSSRALAAVSTAVAVWLAAASTPGAVRGQHLIIPGRAVGPVVLGMASRQLFQQLGPPAGAARPQAGARLWWPDRGLAVRLDREGRVEAVFVESPQFRTAEGLGVGSSVGDVVAAFGPALHAQEDRTTLILAYPALGISFAVRKDRQDRVELVMVYRPG
ncbi:MAG: hypothetical protein RMM30_03405 [Armatimonadota bacterium]|nr:hypothetical protein [Armatimonadota bacterium]MDW8155616.1 hypothetical protein [Armatimonadota bacterium]